MVQNGFVLRANIISKVFEFCSVDEFNFGIVF
jgi:hypothetical protein